MAEEERIPSLSEKDGTDTSSQSKDTYVPEEPTPDISISLLDIQMPETPDSTKSQISDGDTSRLESPKPVKPVLGKVQAKKRLMAFANQFKTLSKSQVKPNLSQHSTGALKMKDKAVQDDTSVNKSRKKTEEKILAIEEIRREESKTSMEDESHNKNISGLFESTRHAKDKSKHERMSDDRKNKSIDRKYSERHRHRDKVEKDSSNQDVKDRNGSIDCSIRKASQDREKYKKDKKKKNHKDKRDNSKTKTNRDKKEEGKDKKESDKEKQDETRERIEATKNKKENIKEKRNDTLEIQIENKDKRDKDKDKWKEKMLSKSNSWAEVRKFGLTLDDVIYLKRRENSEKLIKTKSIQQDYTRYFEQMLMLSNHRLKRQALIAEGLYGPKKYPPESVKLTKRTKGLQLSYCENPRVSLLLGISQLLEAVTPERREKIRDICEASPPRIDMEDTVQQKRNWYQQINAIEHHKNNTWQMTIQLPKSKWDSEDEETPVSMVKEVEKSANELHVSASQQERGSTTSSVTDEDKIDNIKGDNIKEDNKSSEKTIENLTTNDEASTSSSLQPAGNEKLASEYEQFMKMVCTSTDVAKEYSPNRNLVKSASPSSYHEFNIESNLTEANTNIEISPKDKFDKEDKLQTIEGSMKSTECEESTQSTDCQIQVDENIVLQIEHTNKNEDKSEDSKSIPSDWENVRIKVERLSDENTESREVKKKKRKKVISSNSSSNTTSSDSEKEKKKKKRKRKRKVTNSSSSDSDSTDSNSSSSDSSSSEERRRKRKKKKVGKKRKKVKRIMRLKKKRRRKVSDSNSSDSDEHIKKQKKIKKKTIEAKSINNGDISKIISKSPVASSSDETKLLQSLTSGKKIKEEIAGENRKKSDQIISAKRIIDNASVSDNECFKQKKERKGSKSDESFIGQWEMDSVMIVQQNDDDMSSQDRTEESEKIDGLEKGKHRRKRKHNRDSIEQDKDRSSKVNEERIHEGRTRSDEEVEAKRKKKREKDNKSTEFLANWERESERITQQIQNDAKYLKKLEKQKKQRWGETDFDTLNVPSLTQLEKEVYQKQLLADEWEVDSLEAISDLITSKRKSSQSLSKKVEKEVKYDKKTDTYIAIEKEKENVREMKKRQERLCAIRIWEEEQEEGEREEMMLLEQRSKRKTEKTDDWDIEEESHFHKNSEQVCKVNDIAIENEWIKTGEEKNIKEEENKLTVKSVNKRVRKSRWDMGSQSEEKPEIKDIWEEEYTKWSKKNKSEPEFDKIKKRDFHTADYSESSNKSDLIDFYYRKSQSTESVEGSWTEEVRLIQMKNNVSVKHLISAKTNDEQFPSVKEQIDQFKEISESNMKFKEKTIELYSPSSPALSQKSHDVEVSNESSSGNSVLREKKKKEMLITTDELSIPMSGIPLQLTKLRDTKHASNEKIENILDKEPKLEDKDSANSFDIKPVDDLFDISINKPCLKVNASGHMDIFAEFGSEKSLHEKQHVTGINVSSTMHTKEDEMNEAKNALKLIPKQLLIRRNINEQVKPKRILETPLQDPAQHAAALLTIQKKLLESHALKNDINEYPNEEQANRFEQRCDAANNSGNTDNVLLDTTEFSVVSKSLSVIATRESRSPASEKAVSIQSEQSENYDRDSKNDDVKKYKTNRNDTNVASSSVRSPNREHRKRSPGKKENVKRYSHDKDKKERKSDDAEKPNRRDTRGPKTDFVDRRRSSPSGRGRRRRSGSPYVPWEQQRSGSGSPGHSWSRSRSKSPKRKDEPTLRDRDKKRERYDDERSSRSRTDERKEKYARSPLRFGYNEDNFKKHSVASFKNNRDDWSRRRHDNVDRDHEKDSRLYDPMEILRERTNMESEKYRDNRFRTEELDHTFWQCTESGGILRDGNESMDSYTVGQNLSLEYDDRMYYREGSLERNVASPHLKYRRKSNARKDRQWERDKDLSDLDRLVHRSRNRTPPRSRYSPMRQASERFRRRSRSRSRSWSPLRSRTRSRSRSTSRSRPRLRSQSKSRSRSPFDVRSREKSGSISRLRSPEHAFRMSELQSSRSPSPGRDRLKEMGRERKDSDENKKFNTCSERGRRIETIVQSGIISGPNILDPEMGINNSMDTATNFQYSNEGGNEYYYTENNLTYPPCIDESSTSSPKRLSLDDRLELELGIKKQHSKDSTSVASEYPSNFNPNVIAYSSPPQQQQIMYRQQPTVVQVGNVLQVVPADFNGMQSVRREVPAVTPPPPVRSGSSQVVRVGNVLQVVPTSLDWSNNSSSAGDGGGGGGQSITTDQSSGVLYSSAISAHSPSAPSAPMSVPVPVPVPLPVPPAATNTHPSIAITPAAPLPLSLPVPVPVPIPIPPVTAAFSARNEIQQKIVQPVYNYEAILETRRKEREERKRLRELRRKEKERKRIERVNRRALRLLEKNSTSRQSSGVLLDHHKSAIVDPSVLKALKEGEEHAESPSTNLTKEDEEMTTSIKEEDEDAAADEEEDEDDDEVEAEAEDDEEEEEEAEDEDEDDDDDDEKSLQIINQQIEVDETITDANKDQVEIEAKKEWPALPPPPLKGILVVPGFRRNAISNGNLDDLSDADDVIIKDSTDKDEETDKNNECNKDTGSDTKSAKSNSVKPKKAKRIKKSVQFADGVKPGEGTSPSGGEGDMPSPPPPQGICFREGFSDLRRDKIYSFRKSRKEKRARPQKTKKKVKVKIIKLKKPRITPLTAMIMDDSDEMDDRSPPPPPPGSPPPPHLWPSYLSIYNTTVRAVEQSQATTATLTPIPVQAPPPPTPLPLLIPPPPLNYTIQPCSKS
ncbi:uncharacterized protein LOC105837289 isoform X2 [Monomorium pharaonis]|uniref:uncharacterized protein LOC105837289 isoform X2 n=1 Tax=Monomorium pharaonis TaxID=307658 RepID=UPI00063EE00F|nr:uncharacterized protein LOC105837289 isoform X2 [Monomorium pharaonis]